MFSFFLVCAYVFIYICVQLYAKRTREVRLVDCTDARKMQRGISFVIPKYSIADVFESVAMHHPSLRRQEVFMR